MAMWVCGWEKSDRITKSFIHSVGTLILIFIPTPWLALSAPPLGLMYYMFVRFYMVSLDVRHTTLVLIFNDYKGTSNQLQALEVASKTPLYNMFGTTLAGIETIRFAPVVPINTLMPCSYGIYHSAFGSQEFFREQNDQHLDNSQVVVFLMVVKIYY